ncbi:Na+/H+ antiporter NhaC [Faucicola atlantae]|uniref:Na+/H+ antiporter NhaC n=1 Tax=Faucicola atlantae TaxID=34059 RepID=A0A1B8Q9X5_9GAMM|nr:Na+/H+ antiporter NhaC [Moraxella atlantae]OBX75917.1 Na+/H+ antiporter NhaC [Moraxella atlantae]
MTDSAAANTSTQLPPLWLALTPIVLTLAILMTQLFVFDHFAPHVPLVFGIAITALMGYFTGVPWLRTRKGIFHVIHVSMPSLSVLIIVGMLIGVWIASGTVPSLIYYGLNLIKPEYFLLTAMLVCAVVSVSLGTSWGAVGTVGLALMGIGAGFNIPMYWTAGAVISGAFFGDKVSPLSDTTNLAPAVTGTNVFDHIKNMMPTTNPAMLIAMIIYTVMGFRLAGDQPVSMTEIEQISQVLEANFNLSPWLLLPPLVVLALAVTKKPPIPSLFAGVLVGGIVGLLTQPHVGIGDLFEYAQNGFNISTGVEDIDHLLNKGGIQSMMWTISLMLLALGFGGALEKTGCLEAVVHAIVSKVKSFGMVQTSAIGTSFLTNAIAGDPYIAIALPGRMYSPLYRGLGYSTLNLGRALEEGGTLMSPLIPWNAGGAFCITALGLGIIDGTHMENLLYIPLAFGCWIAPILGITYAFAGIFSPKATPEELQAWQDQGEKIMQVDNVHIID